MPRGLELLIAQTILQGCSFLLHLSAAYAPLVLAVLEVVPQAQQLLLVQSLLFFNVQC